MIARKVIEIYFVSVIRDLLECRLQNSSWVIFLQCFFWRFYEQLAREIPADAGLVSDEATVLGGDKPLAVTRRTENES